MGRESDWVRDSDLLQNWYSTDIKMDGVMAVGPPHLTVRPHSNSQVFHYNHAATPDLHAITALTDSISQVAEWNENNHAALTRVICPQDSAMARRSSQGPKAKSPSTLAVLGLFAHISLPDRTDRAERR